VAVVTVVISLVVVVKGNNNNNKQIIIKETIYLHRTIVDIIFVTTKIQIAKKITSATTITVN
jgi:hypothetical protein